MNVDSAIVFRWDAANGVFRPLIRFRELCASRYRDGEAYRFVEQAQRSSASHNHYFAAIYEYWMNLPESLGKRFKTAEHLRKWALCRAGYADERYITLSTPEDALKVASYVRSNEEFAVVAVSDCTVRVFHARSQSANSMGAKEFQQSKEKVFEVIEDLMESARAAVAGARSDGHDMAGASAGTGTAERPSPEPQKRRIK